MSAPQERVRLLDNSGNSLRVVWLHPDPDGGDTATRYKAEWDTAASFDSNTGAALGTHTKISPRLLVISAAPTQKVTAGPNFSRTPPIFCGSSQYSYARPCDDFLGRSLQKVTPQNVSRLRAKTKLASSTY